MVGMSVKRENHSHLPHSYQRTSNGYVGPVIPKVNHSTDQIPDYALQSNYMKIERIVHTTLQDPDISARKRQTPLETANKWDANGAIISISAVAPDLPTYPTSRTTITSYRTIRPTKTVIEDTGVSKTSASILQTTKSFGGQILSTTMSTIPTITTRPQQTNGNLSLTTYLPPITVETPTSAGTASVTEITPTQEPTPEASSNEAHKHGGKTLGAVIGLLVFVIICVYIWGQRRAGYPEFIKFSKWLKKQFKRPKPSIPRDVEGRGTPEVYASSEKNRIAYGSESQGFVQITFPAPTRAAETLRATAPLRHTRKSAPGSSLFSSKYGTPSSQHPPKGNRNSLWRNVDGLGEISPEAVRRDSEDYMASNLYSDTTVMQKTRIQANLEAPGQKEMLAQTDGLKPNGLAQHSRKDESVNVLSLNAMSDGSISSTGFDSVLPREAPRIPTPGFEQALRNSYVQNTSVTENPGDKRISGSSWFGQN